MATPPKFMRFPFAATGDKEAIPDEAQASGSLSYSEGFGLDYERDPTKDAKAKRMPRGGTNQVLYDATSNIQQYQLYGVPYWYDAASNGGTAIQYQKNTMVRFAVGNSENIYISLKDNNTDIPTVEASWFLFQPYNLTLLSRLSVAPFVPVESMTTTAPPANPTMGKAYLIPANATGFWTGKAGQLTEWDGKNWLFTITPNGHGIGLLDGRVFTKVDGIYIEKIALDSQSGKWNYAEAGGTANALTATFDPTPLVLTVGMVIQLKIFATNTGDTTLNVNGLGAKSIVYHSTGEPLVRGDFQAGDIVKLIYDGTSWRLQPSLAYMDKRYSRLTAPTTNTFYVDGQTGNDTNTGFSLAQAFKTIQGAINAISSRYITTGQIRIFVATGSTYSGFTFNQSFVSNWAISLPPGISGAIEVDARSGRGQGCLIPANVNVSLSNFHFQSYFENVNSRGNLTIKDCSFEAPTSTTVPIIGIWGGQAALQGTFYANGKATAFLISSTGATVQIGYQDEILSQPVGINYANGTSFSYANIVAVNGGSIVCTPSVLSFNGGPSGYRFICDLNGVINVKGAGNYIWPGTLEGKIIRGGQYF